MDGQKKRAWKKKREEEGWQTMARKNVGNGEERKTSLLRSSQSPSPVPKALCKSKLRKGKGGGLCGS